MRRVTTTLAVLFSSSIFTLVAPACDDDSDAEVLALIDDSIELENEAIAVVCDCWQEAGFQSRGQCLDDQVLPSQRRCVEDAYLRDAPASQLYLECAVPLVEELGTCLNQRLSCETPSDADPCFSDFDLGLASCIEVPNSVQRALDDCVIAAGGDDPPPPPPPGPNDDDTPPPPPPGPDPSGDDPPPPPPPEPDPSGDDDDTGPAPPPTEPSDPDPADDGGSGPTPPPGG